MSDYRNELASITLTSEMIEAGVSAYVNRDTRVQTYEEIVAEIVEAALEAGGFKVVDHKWPQPLHPTG